LIVHMPYFPHTCYNHFKCHCDWSKIRGTLFETSNFLALSQFPNLRIFLKCHTSHSPCILYNSCKFGCNRALIKGALFWEQGPFCLQLGFRGIFLKLLISHTTCMHYIHVKYACDRLLTKDALLIEQSTFLAFILASIGEIFLKLHTSHFPRMCYI